MDGETCFNIRYNKKLKVLQSTLEEIQEGHDEYAAKASGLFNKME